jgi:predicted PurR-regulated permease PerM
MTPRPGQPQIHASRQRRRALLAVVVLVLGGALLAGCGGSSKPAYCSAVSKVQDAIKSLPSVDDVKKNGVGTLRTAITQLQQNATNAVNQAKADFSTQTAALKTSVNALSSTVKQIAGSPSLQTLALLPNQLTAVGTAAKNLESAVSSKCG